MSTPLYKEALIESKKLREAALEEAKQAVLDSLSPMIKNLLDKEISGTPPVLLEQEEDPTAAASPAPGATPPATPADVAAAPTQAAPPAADASVPATEVPPAADSVPPETQPTPMAAPIASSGMNVPMPDANGNITVNFADLFASLSTTDDLSPTSSEPTPPVASPEVPAAAGGEEGVPADNMALSGEAPVEPVQEPAAPLMEKMQAVHTKLLEAVANGSIQKVVVQEAIKMSLFKAYENFERLKPTLDKDDAMAVESYLNTLYERLLDSAKNNNSYTQRNRDMATKSLKEFALALFEEIEAKGADAHGTDEHGEKAKHEVINSNESEGPSNHAMKASKSKIEDPGKKDSLTVSESVTDAHGSDEGGEMVDEEVAALEEQLREMLDLEEEESPSDGPSEQLDECGDMPEENVNSKMVLKVLGPDGEPMMLQAVPAGEEEEEEEMVDVVGDDDEEEEMSVAADDDELDIELEDEEEEEVLSESARKPVPAVASKVLNENKELRSQLAETQLLTARSLYVNKLWARENLSSGQKRTIVKYLDGARTIAEAKEVYHRIKKVLDNADAARNKGSVGTLAESKSRTALNESARQGSGETVVWVPPTQWQFSADRWAELAGITKKRT